LPSTKILSQVLSILIYVFIPLKVPRARTMLGRWSFTVVGSSLWNSLPAALRRLEMTLHTFKRQLLYTFVMSFLVVKKSLLNESLDITIIARTTI